MQKFGHLCIKEDIILKVSVCDAVMGSKLMIGDFFFFWTLRGVERTVLRTLCLNFFRPKDIEGLYTLKMPVLWGGIYKNPHL